MEKREDLATFFQGKLIVITGGGSGLGLELAEKICGYGGRVVIVGRKAEKLKSAEARIMRSSPPGTISSFQADVGKSSEVVRLFQEIHSAHGQVDGVFVNAAKIHTNDLRLIPIETVDTLLCTNINGAIFTAKAAIPYLSDQRPFLAFTCSVAAYAPTPESALYGMSKRAIVEFSRALRLELHPRGVDVLTFSPGFFNSNFSKGGSAAPFMMSVQSVAMRYLRSVYERKREVVFPLRLVLIIKSWRLMVLLGVSDWVLIHGTRRLHRFYGNGRIALDPRNEARVRDTYGFRRLIVLISPNRRICDRLHKLFGIRSI